MMLLTGSSFKLLEKVIPVCTDGNNANSFSLSDEFSPQRVIEIINTKTKEHAVTVPGNLEHITTNWF